MFYVNDGLGRQTVMTSRGSNSLSNVPAQRPAAIVLCGLVVGCRESTFQNLGATSAYGNRHVGKAFIPTSRTDRDFQAPNRAYFRGRVRDKDPCAWVNGYNHIYQEDPYDMQVIIHHLLIIF